MNGHREENAIEHVHHCCILTVPFAWRNRSDAALSEEYPATSHLTGTPTRYAAVAAMRDLFRASLAIASIDRNEGRGRQLTAADEIAVRQCG